MKALIEELLNALIIQRNLDTLSPAARGFAERHVDKIERQARTAGGIADYTRLPPDLTEARMAMECLALEAAAMTELKTWRLLGADVVPLIERLLAAQGDAPDLTILQLQHCLAELRATTPAATATADVLARVIREKDGQAYVRDQIRAAIDDLQPGCCSTSCAIGRLEHALTILKEARAL